MITAKLVLLGADGPARVRVDSMAREKPQPTPHPITGDHVEWRNARVVKTPEVRADGHEVMTVRSQRREDGIVWRAVFEFTRNDDAAEFASHVNEHRALPTAPPRAADIRALIFATVDDAARDLMEYDRKEDEQLPRGRIDDAIKAGDITVEEIAERFRAAVDALHRCR